LLVVGVLFFCSVSSTAGGSAGSGGALAGVGSAFVCADAGSVAGAAVEGSVGLFVAEEMDDAVPFVGTGGSCAVEIAGMDKLVVSCGLVSANTTGICASVIVVSADDEAVTVAAAPVALCCCDVVLRFAWPALILICAGEFLRAK